MPVVFAMLRAPVLADKPAVMCLNDDFEAEDQDTLRVQMDIVQRFLAKIAPSKNLNYCFALRLFAPFTV